MNFYPYKIPLFILLIQCLWRTTIITEEIIILWITKLLFCRVHWTHPTISRLCIPNLTVWLNFLWKWHASFTNCLRIMTVNQSILLFGGIEMCLFLVAMGTISLSFVMVKIMSYSSFNPQYPPAKWLFHNIHSIHSYWVSKVLIDIVKR